MVKVVKGIVEAEESGSDLAILIYLESPIRPDQLLLPIHQNLHANLELSKKLQVLQQFQSVRLQLDPKKPMQQKATDIFVQPHEKGFLHLVTHVVQNRHAGEQVTHWEKTNKENYHFKWCVLFVCLIPLRLLFSSVADLYHVNFKLQRAYILLCDYRNRGHLDKVDESGYRKIKIHSKKVGCGPISGVQKQ